MTADHELLLTSETVEIAAAQGDKLPRVSILAYSGDVMIVPGFGPLGLDLSGIVLANEIPLLADHATNIGSIVGQGTPTVRAGQLFVEGTANTATPAAQQVVALAKSGHKFQASIGATPLESKRIATVDNVLVIGRTIKAASSFLLVTKSKLREVTICALGCDAGTSVSIAAKLSKESDMTTGTMNNNDSDILAAERARVSQIEATFKDVHLLCPESLQESADKLRPGRWMQAAPSSPAYSSHSLLSPPSPSRLSAEQFLQTMPESHRSHSVDPDANGAVDFRFGSSETKSATEM